MDYNHLCKQTGGYFYVKKWWKRDKNESLYTYII